MKVLDLFCGKGGWSIPFIEDGAEVVGVDMLNLGYPGCLLLMDIRQLNGFAFQGFDFIVGSPPCSQFSKARGLIHGPRQIEKGLELISAFNRIVTEAKPRFWAMENVWRLRKWYPIKPIWDFRIGSQAKRSLWGNLNIPLSPEFRFPKRILNSRRGRYWAKRKGVRALNAQDFAMIPYPIARFIADCVKVQLNARSGL
jgi:site-specific DNA-cytosine methylase